MKLRIIPFILFFCLVSISCVKDVDFDQADEIWSAVFDLISELEIQPIGISTKGFGNIYSKEHKAVLEEKVFSRSAD